MADADLAMYEAKGEGGGEIVVFKRAMREKFERRVSLSEELHRALADGEFELFYQPQVDLRTQRIAGAEALIRWRHPKRGLISPGEFIPVLNSIPISNDVQAWVMRAACLQARQWQMQGREVRIGVNLSPAQFRGMTLPLTTAAVLAETGLPPHLLELEVTEDILLLDDEAALRTFKQLSELGVHLAWDDFGTGYASLTYLKKFPLNRLKIDQSFVRGLSEATNDLAIADYTIRLAKVLGLAVTAEGVESPEAVRLLARMGCDEGQGYLYGRPMPASEFERAFLDSAAHTAA
jgi:EAL domain-containing protein (putative c-di-GMP-specific phosphodiesterase class I)